MTQKSAVTVFRAKHILTMDPRRPEVNHIAVSDGKILALGGPEIEQQWQTASLDERFAELTLMPGLIEAHSHMMAGSLWRYTYCGYFGQFNPQGQWVSGHTHLESVIEALVRVARQQVAGPITGWGFDPIYFRDRRCTREDLDRVSQDRLVGVMHASAHILNVNTAVLREIGFWRQGIDHPGLPLGADGYPTGELRGPEVMGPAFAKIGLGRSVLSGDPQGIADFGRLCVRAGVTTATDLAAVLGEQDVQQLLSQTSEPDYPVTVVPFLRLMGLGVTDLVQKALTLRDLSTERLRLGRIKVVLDGSIQGFTARLKWPGYFNGSSNGLWYTPPEVLLDCYRQALIAGLQVHTHTNGDEATDLAIECMQKALTGHALVDHRFFLQHCQMASSAQFRAMSALGLGVNLFANHHFYWGDQHYALTLGPNRAEQMNACRTALACGVPLAIHSDAPITPLNPLFTAWAAVNRLTATGRTLGEYDKLSVEQALYAITMGAAYSLHMDAEIGSLEVGKRADFCVLHDNPLEVAPESLKEVRVWGTVQGGRIFNA
jgi:predicted amidohydrolase YtcJ